VDRVADWCSPNTYDSNSVADDVVAWDKAICKKRATNFGNWHHLRGLVYSLHRPENKPGRRGAT